MYISMKMYTVILRVCATHHNDTRPHTTMHTNHTQPNTQIKHEQHTNTHTHHTPTHCTQRTHTQDPKDWWTVPDKGTFSWSLGTILTCKSFVTFRSTCFPQDRWSWTILSGKANDWGIGNMLFSTHSQTSKWARSSAHWGEPMVHTTTPHVALNCLIHCLPSVN